jgi:hypothetical protein
MARDELGVHRQQGSKTMATDNKVCNCNQYCLDTICISSDSNLRVRKCWCADCKEVRKQTKANAYKMTFVAAI